MLDFRAANSVMYIMYKYPLIAVLLSVGFLVACGGGGGGSTPAPVVISPPPPPPPSKLAFDDTAASRGLSFSAEFSATYMAMPRYFAGGVASGDIDNDGDIDLFIVRGDTAGNLLFVNNGGIFEDQADARLANPNGGLSNFKLSGPTFADMDGDSDLDLFIGGLDGDPSVIFINDGNGQFSERTSGSGIDTMTSLNTISAAFGDYDLDGDLDLALAHWGTARDPNDPGETETLWRNESTGGQIKFTPVSQSAGISDALEFNLNGKLGPGYDYTFAPNFADINDDGYPDLLMVSDFRGSKVFVNNQDGTFTDTTDRTQITDSNGMGAATGDYDNDGDLDWFVSSIDGNRLYENMVGTLIDISDNANIGAGGWGWGSCFADFNADGHLDIYQTNGWINNNGGNPNLPYTEDRTRLWISDGNGKFTDQAADANIDDDKQGRAIVCADFDNDRDVDVLLLLNETSQAAMLWTNNIASINAVKIDLQGSGPNSKGLGTRIFVKTGSRTQMREISIGSNFTSHNPTQQIIGLGDASVIDELRIVWSDGAEIIQTNVAANQDLIFAHPDR